MRSTKSFRLRLLLICALALLPAVFAACGGDDGGSEPSDEDPQEVLDAAFSNDETISSGVLDLSVDGSVDGSQSGSASLSLTGPFQGDADDPTALPQLDWDVSANAEALGQEQEFSGALTVTDDNAYVTYQDTAYEVGTDTFDQLKTQFESAAAQQQGAAEGLSFEEAFRQGCEQSIQQQGGDPSACDFELSAWFGDPTNEGVEDVDGTPSVHVSGDVDVEQMLTDLIALGSSVPSATGAPSEEQVQQVADAVEEASYDVYVGEDDDLIRQVDFTLAADATQIPEAEASGVEGFELSLSAAVSDVNEEQTIEAPSDPQPIEGLVEQLGGLGALGGLGSSGLGSELGGTSGGDQAAIQQCLLEATTPEEQSACLAQ